MTGELRSSPTLELAASIDMARREGRTVYSLSTPTFLERQIALPRKAGPGTTLLAGRGMPELRDRSRECLFGKWHLPQHECVVVGGAKTSIFCILRTMLPARGAVLIVSPHWPSYEDLAELAHLRPVFHSTRAEDGYVIDAGRLRRDLRESGAGAVICSNPGNPTGRILDQHEIEDLCAATAEAGAVLLLDESFSQIVFDDRKWRASICSPEAHVFVVSSFSKNYHVQGLRLGACLVHRDRASSMIAAHQTLLSAAPTPSQNIALQILADADAIVYDYRTQRKLILDFLASNGWLNAPTEGGFHMFPQIESVHRFRRALKKRNVLSLPGEAFGERYRDHLRICFGKPVSEMHALMEILNDVASVVYGE